MRNAKRITGCRLALCAVLAGLVVIAGCAGPGKEPSRTKVDPAIALFVSGQYAQAIDRLNELARSMETDEELREVYYYLGRCYLAIGQHDRAIEAFGAGVTYGDTGACVDYLEQLKAFKETGERGIQRSETLSRRQLASAITRLVEEHGQDDPPGGHEDPDAALRAVVERGWMRLLPDGDLHAGATVTRAAFYVTLARVARELGVGSDLLEDYRSSLAARGGEPVTGVEATAVLEEISKLRKRHGG